MTASLEARSYKIKPAAECGRVLGSVFTGDPYKRASPHVYGPRADWAIDRLALEVARIVEPPSFTIVELHDVTMVGGGIVICSDGTIVEESLVHVKNSDRFHGFVKNPVHTDELLWDAGTIVVQQSADAATYLHAGQTYDGNYGHWLVDIVPRVALTARVMDLRTTTAMLYPASEGMIRVFNDSLSAYLVNNSQIWNGNIHIPRLIYPTQLTDGAFTKSPVILEVLKNLSLRLVGEKISDVTKIFVLRPPSARRQLTNMAELAEIAGRLGYVLTEPWKMSLTEQAAMFSGARKIIGVLGAELTNLAFAHKDCDLFGLSPATMHDDFYWDLVSLQGGHYFSLHGEPETPSLGMNSAFSIEPALFSRILYDFDRTI